MTDEILESDIEAALKVLSAGGGESEIAIALMRRKVAPARAARVAADMIRGRPVTVGAVPNAMPPRSRVRAPQSAPKKEEPVRHSVQKPAGAPHPGGMGARSRKFLGMLLFVGCPILAASLAFLYLGKSKPNPQVQHESEASATVQRDPSMGATAPDSTARQPQPSRLVFQLRTNGLRLNDNPVAPGNALSALAAVLGAPSRTNRAQSADQEVYNFDSQGLALYSQADGSGASVVLYYQELGDSESARRPFTGLLEVEEQGIRADTDWGTLAAIKALGLTATGTATNILSGQYGSLGLTFMYPGSSRRLGFAEIDLR